MLTLMGSSSVIGTLTVLPLLVYSTPPAPAPVRRRPLALAAAPVTLSDSVASFSISSVMFTVMAPVVLPWAMVMLWPVAVVAGAGAGAVMS